MVNKTVVNSMSADDLEMQGARASADMVLFSFSGNIVDSPSKRLMKLLIESYHKNDLVSSIQTFIVLNDYGKFFFGI